MPSETERFSVAREDGLNELRLEKKMDGPVIVDLFANAEPLYIALDEKAVCPVHTRPSKVSRARRTGKAAVSLTGIADAALPKRRLGVCAL